jgi:tight adherence protein C
MTFVAAFGFFVGVILVMRTLFTKPKPQTLPLYPPNWSIPRREAPVRDSAVVRTSAGIARRISPAGRIERLDRTVQQAGRTADLTVERVLSMKLGGALVFGVIGFLYLSSRPGVFGVVVLAFGVIGGWVVPEMSLTNRAQARREEVRSSLPDAIDQLAVTVRAGLSVDSALMRVASTLRGPLADELSRVVQDIQLGVSRTGALRSLGERMDIPELNQFVRALVQADTLGVPIATTLTTQAESMRIQRRLRSEEMAMKLPVKILAPTMVCILPALMIVVLGPAVLQLMQNLSL